MARDVEKISSVSAVEHGESRVEVEVGRITTQQAIRDAVKRSRPRQNPGRNQVGLLPGKRLAHNRIDTACHFLRRTPCERE